MPILPLNSALSVLNQQEYPFISVVCDCKAPVLSKLSRDEGEQLITRILRTLVLSEEVPSYVSSIRVEDNTIVCEEKELFSVSFTTTVIVLILNYWLEALFGSTNDCNSNDYIQ